MVDDIKLSIFNLPQREKAFLMIAFFMVFGIFLFTLPKQITLEDDGLFLMAGYFAGIPHPPGYPLFSLIGNVFSLLPIDSVPTRIHAMSAFFGAATCISMALFIRLLIPSFSVAVFVVLMYAVSKVFWSQSIIAEVYTLNAFLIFTLFFLIYLVAKDINENQKENNLNHPRVKVLLAVIAGVYGLSLTLHVPIIVLSTPSLLFLLWPARKLIINRLFYYGLFFCLGLIPYIWLIWRSNTDVIINFYGPIQSFSDFIFTVFRQEYVSVDISSAAGLGDKIEYGRFLLSEAGSQFFWFSYLFLLIGFIVQWIQWPKRVCVALLIFYLTNSFLFLFMIYFDYDILSRSVFSVYPMLSYAVMAIWIGLGVHQFATWFQQYVIKSASKEIVVVFVGIILVIGTLEQNFQVNNRHGYRWASDYATQLLSQLPKKSILFLSGDIPTFTVGYTHYVEGSRNDVDVFDIGGLVFSNRLFDRRKVSQTDRLLILENFVKNSNRSVCTSDAIISSQSQIDYWLFSCFADDESDLYRVGITPELLSFYEEILTQKDHTDVWTVHHRQQLIRKMGVLLGKLSVNKEKNNTELLRKYRNPTLNEFHGALGYLEGKVLYDLEIEDINEMIEVISNVKHVPYLAKKKDKASLYYIRGYVSVLAGNQKNAIIEYKTSLELWPEKNNPAFNALLQLYKHQKNTADYHLLKRKFY